MAKSHKIIFIFFILFSFKAKGQTYNLNYVKDSIGMLMYKVDFKDKEKVLCIGSHRNVYYKCLIYQNFLFDPFSRCQSYNWGSHQKLKNNPKKCFFFVKNDELYFLIKANILLRIFKRSGKIILAIPDS